MKSFWRLMVELDLKHFIFWFRWNEMGGTSSRVDARLSIVNGCSRRTADGFVGKDVVDGGINFEDKVWKKEMGFGVVA